MPDDFKHHFACIRSSIDDAERRLKDSAPLEDNREALKTLMWDFLNKFSGLVEAGGGETIYIPSPDYLGEDIEKAFADPIEAYDVSEGHGFSPKVYGTLDRRTQGLRA